MTPPLTLADIACMWVRWGEAWQDDDGDEDEACD